MAMFKTVLAAALVAGTLAATPASAIVTTFASINQSVGNSLVFANNGTGGNNASYRSNGFGGSIFTTTSAASVRPSQAVAGATDVTFSFLNALSPFITNVAAKFTLTGAVANSPVQTFSGFKFQTIFSGNFSLISVNAITIGSQTFAAGSNLLSGVYSNATIFGPAGSTSGSFSGATTSGSTITYTSDFLNFAPTVDRDFSLNLTGLVSNLNNVNVGLSNANGRALRSFRASAGGSFSTDPAPTITAFVPEPEVWGLMVVGFGMVGAQIRRRARRSAVVA